jgi:RimJ/RimL family protein N-acetyltransferase
MDPVELREDGLLLRPWRPSDAEAVRLAVKDPAMPRLLREDAIESVARHPASSGSSLGVFDAATGELLGTAGLVRLDHTADQAELGYWTTPTARGRGVATSAARAMARYAFEGLGLHRMLWRARVGNHASRLVAARIGVRFEGIARASLPVPATLAEPDNAALPGGWADAWVGALLAGELRESDAPHDPALDRAAARCRVFTAAQPTLPARTKDGQVVRLRPLRSGDVPACVRACRDPDTVRYTTVPEPYDEAQAEAFIHGFAPGVWARGTEAVFAIADEQDAFVGTMALRLAGDELFTPVGDVGYLIGPWARGRGYASAALRALCDWGFEHLALRRIEWKAYVGNTASRTTAERAGFRVEGELRQALQHRGTVQDAWIGARIATGEE